MTVNDWLIAGTFVLVIIQVGLSTYTCWKLHKTHRAIELLDAIELEEPQWISLNGQDPFLIAKNQSKKQ